MPLARRLKLGVLDVCLLGLFNVDRLLFTIGPINCKDELIFSSSLPHEQAYALLVPHAFRTPARPAHMSRCQLLRMLSWLLSCKEGWLSDSEVRG